MVMPDKKEWWRFLIAVLAVMGVLAVANAFLPASRQAASGPGTPTAYADDQLEAKIICQKFGLKQLKAPATAKFEPLETVAAVPSDDQKWKPLGGVWESVSWVDSQNEFGALIRSTFTCAIKKAPDGRWKLLELNWLESNP